MMVFASFQALAMASYPPPTQKHQPSPSLPPIKTPPPPHRLAFSPPYTPFLPLALSLAISLSPPALAATIKMGSDEGSLVFSPSSISVPSGEKIVFFNNKGFPHNVVFEQDGLPAGVRAEDISREDYMNDQGEQFVVTLTEKGTYRFFCEPHRAAGMFGEITVT